MLEFNEGVATRPILRPAYREEQLKEGGTRVRVRLKNAQLLEKLLFDGGKRRATFQEVCAAVCPTIDVNVYARDNRDQFLLAVRANDWLTMDGAELLARVRDLRDDEHQTAEFARFGPHLRVLHDAEGRPIGRACLVPLLWRRPIPWPGGRVTVGGLRSTELTGVAGVLAGRPTSADRHTAVPFLAGEELRRFATEEGLRMASLFDSPDDLNGLAHTVRGLGGDTGDLPIAEMHAGWISADSLSKRDDLPDEVLLMSGYELDSLREFVTDFSLLPNVIAVESSIRSILQTYGFRRGEWPGTFIQLAETTDFYELGSLNTAVLEALAKAWRVEFFDLLREERARSAERRARSESSERVVARSKDREFRLGVQVINRPPAPAA